MPPDTMISDDMRIPLVQALLAWYERHRRDLPWRGMQDPYPIWLSEIILQQTRVAQGMPYWRKFMEAYPTVQHLAAAPDQEVMRLWQGLGYYSRARNLLKAARLVAEQGWPITHAGLLALPGVGAYTAAAIGSFAFGIPEPVVDGNVIRVVSRLFKIEADVTKPATVGHIRELAQALIPHDKPADFNQAIMEFGAIQCTPVNPACVVCPLQNWCETFAAGLQNEIPKKSSKSEKKLRFLHYLIVFDNNQRTVWHQRSGKGIWHSLFEPILIETETQNDVPDFKSLVPQLVTPASLAGEAIHILSHQRLHIRFYQAEARSDASLPEGYNWYSEAEVERMAKPIIIAKFIEKLFSSK